MTSRLATVALLTSLVFASCSKHKEASGSAPAAATNSTEKADAKAVSGAPTGDSHRKVIRTGRVDLVVESYDAARTALDALLASAGGYIDSTNVEHYQGAVSSATLVLRIPQGAFGSLVPELKKLGEVSAESTKANDVTDQYVDISARLVSAQTLEKRLLELAADRTSGVEALLAVERELARVRGEVEGYEGRLRQWNDQIEMSTLTLTLATKSPAIAAAPDPGLGSRIQSGFSDSVTALQSFAGWLAVTATALLPWLILVVPGLLLLRRMRRRYGSKLPAAIVAPTASSAESR